MEDARSSYQYRLPVAARASNANRCSATRLLLQSCNMFFYDLRPLGAWVDFGLPVPWYRCSECRYGMSTQHFTFSVQHLLRWHQLNPNNMLPPRGTKCVFGPARLMHPLFEIQDSSSTRERLEFSYTGVCGTYPGTNDHNHTTTTLETLYSFSNVRSKQIFILLFYFFKISSCSCVPANQVFLSTSIALSPQHESLRRSIRRQLIS